MRRVLLIFNPAAARTKPGVIRTVTGVLERRGCEVRVESTTAQGDAEAIARDGAEQGIDVVAVYGGDGTMMQAVHGMRGTPAVLGLIRGGTGNLLASNLHIPRRPRDAARVIAEGVPRRIDLGELESEGSIRYFAVASGAGYDADLMANTTGAAKRRWGMGAYVGRVVATARNIRPAPFRIAVDGQSFDVEAATVIVANCRTIVPPLLSLGPDVSVDDGWLDVVILNARGVVGASSVVWRLMRHGPDGGGVTRLRGREVHVESDTARHVQLDGEADGVTPFTARVIPRGLTVLVPRPPGVAAREGADTFDQGVAGA